MRPRARTVRGSASVLAVALLGVATTGSVLVAVLAGAVVDQRRAESAADLAALAGAGAAQDGRDACVPARAVTGRNGGRLVACAVADLVVSVRVERRTRSVLGLGFTAVGRARAGPAPP